MNDIDQLCMDTYDKTLADIKNMSRDEYMTWVRDRGVTSNFETIHAAGIATLSPNDIMVMSQWAIDGGHLCGRPMVFDDRNTVYHPSEIDRAAFTLRFGNGNFSSQ